MKLMRRLLFLFIVYLYSCGIGNKPAKQGETFFFYPGVNVYYDIEQKEYYVFDSTANHWKKQTEKPMVEDSLGKKVLIEHAANPVYKDNEQHRLIYGTALYSSSSDVKQKYIEDSLASLPPPPTSSSQAKPDTSVKKDKKKGFLKRIWERIFK